MKKSINILSMAAIVIVGTVMMGCNKIEAGVEPQPENNTVTLTTTVGLDGGAETRALTSTGVKTFAANETMALFYCDNQGYCVKAVSEPLTAGNITNEGKSATFTFTLTNPDKKEEVFFIYPAAMADEDDDDLLNYKALNCQDGTLATLSSSLDLATKTASWNGESLPAVTLENQLAILAITLKDATGTNNITDGITGLTIYAGTQSYAISRSAAAGPIYVAICPTWSANIKVTATDGTNYYSKSLTGKTYEASNGYNVSWRMTQIEPPFTVNNSGNQVNFAPGNLQATYYGSAWTWAFAANQWDYIGNAAGNTSINGNGTISGTGTVDLFGWVGASSTWTGAAQYGISNATTVNSTDTYGNNDTEALKSDWGNTISDGYTWRTLTKDEWGYVFNNRSSRSTVGTTNNARYTHATINTDGSGVNGIILFPDLVTIESSAFTTLGNVNSSSNWDTKCTTAQWTALAAKGCVFLPAAGRREGSLVEYAGNIGYYWSSSPYKSFYDGNADSAYRVYFSSYDMTYSSNLGRHRGMSVRLVREL